MPNLEGLGLQNFRTFTTKELLEFAPITLITGTNNSGKSTVFKAIQFLAHNFKDGINSETLDFKNMRHELGNLERIVNRVSMKSFTDSGVFNPSMYSRLSDYRKKDNGRPNVKPIFEANEDLVFAFPIKFGNSREISATLEVRYGLIRHENKSEAKRHATISHDIKSIAIVKDGEYLHWSNIMGLRPNYDDADDWEMVTSLDLKKIIRLIRDTPLEIVPEYEPRKEFEEYFTIDLFSKIKKYNSALLDHPFFKSQKDDYKDFTEKFIEGESLFSDYSRLTAERMSRLLAIEQKVLTELLQGRDNNQYKLLDCFKHNYSYLFDETEKDIARAELKDDVLFETQETDAERNYRDIFKPTMFQTTPNSKLYTSLLGAIENDLLVTVQQKFESLKNISFLPTTRGRNREWFIDEHNTEDTQIARDFSAIYFDRYKSIEKFVTFWIGKGEINELDENGKNKQKGFNIGKELSVFRDEAIGLTKIFLVNFDGTKTPLVDLGYGVSQLLPIIMKIAIIAHEHQSTHQYDFNNQEGYHESEAIYFRASTLLVEEPEANLHPSLQSKIAELFIDAASRFNIQFIIETHSEYLIYKFQEYIGRKIVDPAAVKMYYFNHPNYVREGLKEKYIEKVEIGNDGSIDYDKYFGKGFFDEQTNLKLSLLNIQRDRFIEDYVNVKEKLKDANKTLVDYDTKIEELDQNLLAATQDKNELEEQLNETKKQKDEEESFLQKLIKQQEDIIDEYTDKADYSRSQAKINDIIDISKIDNSKTLKYLSTGKFLLDNLDNTADFAPVIIQYGRAVECEMIQWITNFRISITNGINSHNLNSWCDIANYNNKIKQIFTDVGLTPVDHDFNYLTVAGHKVNILHLKNYTKSAATKFVFGQLTQIFELLYDISPSRNATFNYTSVPLLVEFSNYLRNIWRDYNGAERLFNTYRSILDLRNCAGHTYSDSVCVNDIINKATAESYVTMVETFFGCL